MIDLSPIANAVVGKFLAGLYVNNKTPTVVSGKVLLGWLRLTTGSAHVAGTDHGDLQ